MTQPASGPRLGASAPLASTFLLAAAALFGSASCGGSGSIAPEVLPESINQSMVACGERIFVGAPIVLWSDLDGYSAYETTLHFKRPSPLTETPPDGKLRYKPGRSTSESSVKPGSRDLSALKRTVDMFVVHYDVCGTSQTCFKVLHDRRALSVHFMLDVDGTIYQTMDLRDTAWHARQTNGRSIGIEIAQIGAYPLNEAGDATLAKWYSEGPDGTRLTLPKDPSDLGVRTPRFEGRPARDARVRGRIQGGMLQQYDFTQEQHESLVKLTAALCRTFPRIEPDAPRGDDGSVLKVRMPERQEANFHGIVGHYHVSTQKIDPGPAFHWESFLAEVKLRLLRM